MGNATLRPDAFGNMPGVTPPPAAPAQPGEVRNCLNCIRCTEVRPCIGGDKIVVDCVWRGDWHWPVKGCDRWAKHPEPLQVLLPWVKPYELPVYQGPKRPARRFR